MGWADPCRRVTMEVWSVVLDDGTSYRGDRIFEGDQIQSATWDEEVPMVGIPRSPPDLTLRVANDLAEGTGDRSGWRGPRYSVDPESGTSLIGQRILPRLGAGDGMRDAGPVYVVDNVEATSDGATIHATSDEARLKALDIAYAATQYSGSSRLTTSSRVITWLRDVLGGALGISRGRVDVPSSGLSNPSAPARWDIDPGSKLDAVTSGVLAYVGYGYYARGLKIWVAKDDGRYDMDPSPSVGRLTWPEPSFAERYARAVVTDPVTGDEEEVTLDESSTGEVELSIPWYSSSYTAAKKAVVEGALRRRYTGVPVRMDVPGYDGIAGTACLDACARAGAWAGGTQWMSVARISTTYDGGLRQTLEGTLADVETSP